MTPRAKINGIAQGLYSSRCMYCISCSKKTKIWAARITVIHKRKSHNKQYCDGATTAASAVFQAFKQKHHLVCNIAYVPTSQENNAVIYGYICQ